uniref:Large ribosomal subunit protein uL23c n=1 Tax=Gaultheria fragrantissima TaxID=586110 RepID=A0A8A4YM98_9ERIC|nr:ribosomal protein L23 [Gaultheria fragrantissima]YP_010238570.1 ribosomal protein L23 [Gaultheria fragrantissima]YP_010352432.1 ribosomal protein L23 [Gaultheria nummularioides]YP_010352458.1 ribosomal protein L23 [Gaultheria nummularioides]YP_010692006.1 ribosomal protein L23 [Gaultheria pyrolifolia]YP_010692032.1 ribosomal protein L23 [Gaultheria pyrolifolia]YP_010692096.1 ribosomal protein L23 [Gaultheria longibracteolata]YP_010692122.1 ribosomal protein L23 [Gaultheria longibracteolat
MESNMQYLQTKVFGYSIEKNQYTFNVESGLTRTEIKHWVELFFGVKVIAMNSHRLPGKGKRTGRIMEHTMHYRRMIITLQPGYSIFPLRKRNRIQINKYVLFREERPALSTCCRRIILVSKKKYVTP